MGESFGNYICGSDDEVVPFITSANVACGFHASDPLIMQKTVAMCKKNNVSVGAHPGFPDLVGFGRRNMQVSPAELKAMVICEGIYAVNPKLILLGLAGSKLLTAAKKRDSELRRRFLRIELMKMTVR